MRAACANTGRRVQYTLLPSNISPPDKDHAVRDAIELEVFKHLFHSIAEEMGAALRRTAFSPNIKERRDYSCAVFDGAGNVIAMGDHMPVHLGSMPMSVLAAIADLELGPGDLAMLNDPFRGGTHLPDITLVAPVFIGRVDAGDSGSPASPVLARWGEGSPARRRTKTARVPNKPQFFVASRAHHADVGGQYAGSMGICREIYQEGIRIPPVKLMRGGQFVRDVLALVLNNVRTPREREGDLGAQVAACHTGGQRLRELCARYGLARVQRAASELLDYSEELMRAFLAEVPRGRYAAEDFLDDDGLGAAEAALEADGALEGDPKPVRIAVQVTFRAPQRREPFVEVDFTGSDPQVAGSVNAVEAITYSACFYVFRCLLEEDVPATAGLMRPVRVIAPRGTIVNALPPAAVAGGNVECSQRIVDVLLRALAQALPQRIPAAASGTMNNLTIGGSDPSSNEPFAYYETIAGGMGARPTKDGVSGIHCHMTNSWNTPAEALEYAYPFRVWRYGLRRGSGGVGKFRGGDGIVREVEVLTESQVTLLADRRRFGPYGLEDGSAGAPGRAAVIRRDGSELALPGKFSTRLHPGERIRIESPGGGGWGKGIG